MPAHMTKIDRGNKLCDYVVPMKSGRKDTFEVFYRDPEFHLVRVVDAPPGLTVTYPRHRDATFYVPQSANYFPDMRGLLTRTRVFDSRRKHIGTLKVPLTRYIDNTIVGSGYFSEPRSEYVRGTGGYKNTIAFAFRHMAGRLEKQLRSDMPNLPQLGFILSSLEQIHTFFQTYSLKVLKGRYFDSHYKFFRKSKGDLDLY